MFILKKDKIKSARTLGITMLCAGVGFIVINYILSFAYIGSMLAGACFALGIIGIVNASRLEKRYTKFFNDGREMLVSEVVSESGISEKKVLQDLRTFTNPKDKIVFRNTDVVKFQS